MARTSDVGAPAVGAARRTASPSDADELFRDLYAEHGPALLRLTTALTGGDRSRAEDLVQETMLRAWTHRDNSDFQHRSPRAWLMTTARPLAIDAHRARLLWRSTLRRPWSGGGLVLQRIGQLVTARDAELLVGPLQVAFHGPDRQLHLGGDLLVGPACRGLHRRIELALSQPQPGGDEPDGGRDGPLAAGQQPRGPLLGGSGPASLSGVAQQDGGLGAGFRGVEDGAEILEVVGDLAENFAVPGGEGAGVGGAGGRQVAVDLGGQRCEPGRHLAGMPEAGQAVQRADGADQVTDLLAEVGRHLEPLPGGGEIAGGGRRPG